MMNLTNEEQAINIQHQLTLLLAYLDMHDYRFTTISPASHAKVNSRVENGMAKSLIDIFGWNRPFKREAIDIKLFDLMQAAKTTIKVGDLWKSQVRVSSIDGLLFMHSAYPTTSNEAVFFGPDTYRFSNAIHQYLATHQQPIHRAVDIGTGSGVGAVLLALALSKSASEPKPEILAVDINSDALNLARVNINAAEIHNIILMHSDLLHNVPGSFDLIIANPPYLLDESERTYRHGGGQLGANLSLDIVDSAIERLNPNGTLLLYTGVAIVNGYDAFHATVAIKLNYAGLTYEYTEIDPDIFGEELCGKAYSIVDRIAAVVLIAVKQAD